MNACMIAWAAVAVLACGAAFAMGHPATAPSEPWSRPAPLSQTGATDSPGGTHPLAVEGNTVHAIWSRANNIYLRSSPDGGATWGHTLPVTAGGTALYPCSIEASGGALHLIWPDRRNDGKWEPYYKRSTDGGKTWSQEMRLSPGTHLFRPGTAACGPAVHLVWGSNSLEEKVPAGNSFYTWTWGEIYYKRSTDGGLTWEKDIRLTEPNSTAMRPGVAASGKYVHVTWFDRRDAKQRPGWDWDIYYKRSTDGGATWEPDVRMSRTPEHSRHPQVFVAEPNRVCCVWEDGTTWEPGTNKWGGDGRLMAAVSLDNGRTWQPPKRITSINSPNGRATHSKSFSSGSTIYLTWMDAEEGAAAEPIRATAAYYMSSLDGGVTWSKPERLMGGLSGQPAGVAGTTRGAIELLNVSGVINVLLREGTSGEGDTNKGQPMNTTAGKSAAASAAPKAEPRGPSPPADGEEAIRFQVLNRAVGKIDPRLFGQFMERPSWGEIGPEAAVVPGTHDLQPAVVKLLQDMRIPIVRFPGGTDVDHMDWRDMVDNVPGRDPNRPVSIGHLKHTVTNRFGYDEFLRMAEKMGWETIIVVNLRDGQLGLRPLKEAALHAAGLAAYCNAPVGAKLPQNMPDWPSLRAKNGREKPYGVKYFQLGNETWAWDANMKAAHAGRYEEAYVESIAAYEQAIHAVDPSVQLITDYNGPLIAKVRQRLGDKIAYLCGHYYMPWMIRKVEKDGNAVPPETLTAEEIWYAWVATPKIDSDGRSILESNVLTAAPALGYKVAVTEWNWNGGWGHDVKNVALNSSLARGLGAAGFVHALMRKGDVVEIATQSMLVGKGWGIAAILVDPNGVKPPRRTPSGMVTTLYGLHHGDRLMEMKDSGVPTYKQPLRLEGIRPSPKVATIDALATASEKAVFWHAINRSFYRGLEVAVDLTAVGPIADPARLYILEGHLEDEDAAAEGTSVARILTVNVPVKDGVATVALPARSVVVLEAQKK